MPSSNPGNLGRRKDPDWPRPLMRGKLPHRFMVETPTLPFRADDSGVGLPFEAGGYWLCATPSFNPSPSLPVTETH